MSLTNDYKPAQDLDTQQPVRLYRRAMTVLNDIDLKDPQFHADPYPTYALLRSHAPVVRNEGMGYWLVSRYDDVAAALRHPEQFTSGLHPVRDAAERKPDQMIRSFRRLPSRFAASAGRMEAAR
jgi:cytochrome P450